MKKPKDKSTFIAILIFLAIFLFAYLFVGCSKHHRIPYKYKKSYNKETIKNQQRYEICPKW